MPRSTAAVLWCLGLAACVDGNAGTGPDSPAPTDVAGLVSSVKTGRGVPNLVVALVRDGSVLRVAASDGDGRFTFPDVPPGDYVARLTGIELAGLGAGHTAFEPPVQSVRIAGASTEPLLFGVVGLIPPRIAGDVTCDGIPVAGARVRVIGGATDLVVTTNDQGRFGATGLGTGHHAVIPVASPCPLAPAWTAVELLPGQAAEVDFGG